ncbi:hypothetical protein LPW11_11005 [Geomonas sp. RF6]|uniref:ATP-grasp domain-containing protein n=1 Tax=Geomonas sp. RF6 TaxID=2897342 RepID=UPI001E50C645|nr:hypothetical protein [Geomonas sp. RF6]UFS72702.1 hypothetical protein LPW11_11005 [Geomonas sp. RF6]
MRIGIHPDHMWGSSYSDRWIEFLMAKNVEIVDLDLLAPDFLEQAHKCDGIMWRWFHTQDHKQSAKMILYTIDKYLGIPVFPSEEMSWHFDDKVAQYYLLKTLDAPQPDASVFWDIEAAISWARSAIYPTVFKLAAGAGASNVLKVDSSAHAVQLIRKMFCEGIFPMTMNEYRGPVLPRTRREAKARVRRVADALRYARTGDFPRLPEFWWKPEKGYVYFQEFLPGNAFDTRVTVIGDRAFAFRRMNRPNDFRASGSGNIDWAPGEIDPACLNIAFEVSERAGFQTMAYDFLYKAGKPVICEISYTFVDTAVFNCPGHWDRQLNWHEGHMWPEEAQVEDFLAVVARAGRG